MKLLIILQQISLYDLIQFMLQTAFVTVIDSYYIQDILLQRCNQNPEKHI